MELRFKLICTTEIKNKRLNVEVQQLDGAGNAQKTEGGIVEGPTELDFKVDIFKELENSDRNQGDTHVTWTLQIILPPKNMNKGALLIE